MPKPGARVRIRAGVGSTLPCGELSHFQEEAGLTGTVMAVRAMSWAPRHPYLVELDRPPSVRIADNEARLAGRHFAADELELAD